MKYEKAKTDVIQFDGSGIFMVTSEENDIIAQYIKGRCGIFDEALFKFSGSSFTCGQFDGVSPEQILPPNKHYEYTYNAATGVWNCTIYK